LLREALEELPVNLREVLVMCELEGMSYKEIAAVMEMPIGTVMSALALGRAQWRERLMRARYQEEQDGPRRSRALAPRLLR
jgi:RNA polymerase sigma factor (sigma-70 family)